MAGNARTAPAGRPSFDRSPLVLAWEITRACPLRCGHCRAEAQRRRDPRELTTAEGLDLIRQAAEMGVRVFVVTGGDPLARPDVYELIAAAADHGMHVGFSPSVTPRLRPSALFRAVAAGAGTLHLSLDGARAATHDRFRGVSGSFERTLGALEVAANLPVRLQAGTTVCRSTVDDLPDMAGVLDGWVDGWSLFFLVPTGRATASDLLAPDECERVLRWLATERFPFAVRTIEAPAYRRVLSQLGRPVTPGVADGNGFCFVSHRGDVCPSGFLQVGTGNIRQRPLAHWYRDHPLFVALRDPERLDGKCGCCPYRYLCGGSRAHAWALTGDPLAADPSCPYEPPGWWVEDRGDQGPSALAASTPIEISRRPWRYPTG
jgi:AdoMet-dependent heme synthase